MNATKSFETTFDGSRVDDVNNHTSVCALAV